METTSKKLKKRIEDDDRADIGKGHLFDDDINKKSDEIGSKRNKYKHATQTSNIRKSD